MTAERPAPDACRPHVGGCHCGAVQFSVSAPRAITVERCNCSICVKSAYLHLIVPTERFRLERGAADLLEYGFNTGTARHLFCGRCGVKAFYVPRSNPNGYSVNLRCIDAAAFDSVRVRPFDGRNFERNVGRLAHLA